MQAVPEAVLCRIFSQFDKIFTFVRCSAVCKRWAEVMQACKLKCLHLQHYRYDDELDRAISIMRLLQGWQQQGRLQQLLRLELLLDADDAYALLADCDHNS